VRSPAACTLAFAVTSLALAPACSTAPPKESALMKQVEGLEVTKHELETVLYGYSYHFAGRVEQAAGEIHAETSDPAVRRAAIEWNLYAPAEMMRSCFNTDPLVGLVSATSFVKEMRAFFETGNGKDVFGPHQDIAVATSGRLETDLAEMVGKIWPTGDVDKLVRVSDEWSAAHPIQDTRFVRDTFSPAMAKTVGGEVAGGLAAAGSINEQMASLTHRANIMTAYLPRQVHWQAALIMEDSKALIAEATDSTLVAVRGEMFAHLDPVFTFADQQRALIVQDLARERAAVLTAIADERSKVLSSLVQERTQVLATIAEQRDATMRDLNELTLLTLDKVASQSSGAVDSAVDRMFLRTMQLLALPLIFVAGVIVVAMFWIHRTVNRILVTRETGP
jgi:hypothetical protein